MDLGLDDKVVLVAAEEARALETTPAEWAGPIDVTVKGTLLATATARAATVGLTRSLAREFARAGIRANCVSIALGYAML
jgi:NAD(P)-dependent dehydrogenase (short-subunit alcohol dehydrogenase family)